MRPSGQWDQGSQEAQHQDETPSPDLVALTEISHTLGIFISTLKLGATATGNCPIYGTVKKQVHDVFQNERLVGLRREGTPAIEDSSAQILGRLP